MKKSPAIETKLVHIGVRKTPYTGAIALPIYQTVTYQHKNFNRGEGYDYSRTSNPTRDALEEGITTLDGGARASAFSSGMAAITAVLGLFRPGDHLVVTEDLYGGTYRVLKDVFAHYGITYTYTKTSDLAAVSAAIRPETKAIFIETPSNPLLRISNISALAAIAKAHDALLIVDNTFHTPYLQRPIELGADLVVYSASKYISGHNDVLGGLCVAASEALGQRIAFLANATGGVLGPQDAWLTVRGLKTLAVRMDRHQENAQKMARWLQNHPKVRQVYYPGLEDHPGYALNLQQAKGPGGMLSFLMQEPEKVATLIDRLQLILYAESLGGTETLITHPTNQTHRELSEQERQSLGIHPGLLRLSVGLEKVEDVMADLDQALNIP